jgi:hypothetical protein
LDIERGKEKIDIAGFTVYFRIDSRWGEMQREREKERQRETFSHVPKAVTFSPV